MINFFFPELFIISHSRFELLHLSFPEFQAFCIISSRSSIYIIARLHVVLSTSLFFLSSFYLTEFFMEALHGGSSRILFILQLSSRFLLKLRSAKLYSKINMVLNTCFVLRSSSILHVSSEVQFFLPYLLRWCYVILDNLSSCFMIHMLSRMRYFKSTNLFVGVISCHVSPKAFPKDCCYLWCS